MIVELDMDEMPYFPILFMVGWLSEASELIINVLEMHMQRVTIKELCASAREEDILSKVIVFMCTECDL